ncbi:MAG: hypothetical protein HY367_02490 [Candidatus Aenigmarchaeota archaeon]|nr:hypothetical protein [Candidatus Aenigmarchaeota archaeon]
MTEDFSNRRLGDLMDSMIKTGVKVEGFVLRYWTRNEYDSLVATYEALRGEISRREEELYRRDKKI